MKNAMRLLCLLSAGLGAMTLSISCSEPVQCNADSCPTGCCSADGVCQAGSSPLACGTKGNACEACAANACVQNACVRPVAQGGGAGGGNAAAGGGTASGGGTAAGGGGTDNSNAELQIQAVRDAGDGPLSPGLPIDNVTVTALKPQIPEAVRADGGTDDGPGFFVQASQMGPALFVRVDPSSLTPAVTAGKAVSFVVTGVGKQGGLKVASGIDTFSASGDSDVARLVQDINSKNFNEPGVTDSLESEVVSVSGTVGASSFVAAGLGFRAAPFFTAGTSTQADGGTPLLQLRLPLTLVQKEDLSAGCTVSVESKPLWRFNQRAQVSAFTSGDLSQVTCPAPKLVSANATDATTVVLSFDRSIDAATSSPSTYSIDTVTISAAVVAGKAVTLTTSALEIAKDYTVKVLPGVKDTRQSAVQLTANSAVFRYALPATRSPVVISQIYGGAGAMMPLVAEDFVELHNRSAAPVAVGGWSVQYAVNASTLDVSGAAVIPAGTTIAAGAYFLVRGAGGTSDAGVPLIPADGDLLRPDGGRVDVGTTNGKVFLSDSPTLLKLTSNGCQADNQSVIDFVGYGNASCRLDGGTVLAPLSGATGASRKNGGCAIVGPTSADFEIVAPSPRNSSSAPVICP